MEEFDLGFLFTKSMNSSLVLKTRVFRSEKLYAEDLHAEHTALNYLHQLRVKCAEDHMFLVYVDSQIRAHSAVRSHKGLLYECRDLAQLPHRSLEVDCGDCRTRLAVVVDIGAPLPMSCAHIILNYLFACIVISPHPLEHIGNLALRWIERSDKSVRGIDYDALTADLEADDELGIVRYFVVDNGRPELLVVVAQRGVLQNKLHQALACVGSN